MSNFEHEYYLNEKKRQIVIPVGSMIDIMTEELEDLVAYEPHIELDDVGNKKTPISLASRFLNNLGSVTKQSPVSTQNISDITFDYGGTAAQTAGVATELQQLHLLLQQRPPQLVYLVLLVVVVLLLDLVVVLVLLVVVLLLDLVVVLLLDLAVGSGGGGYGGGY